MKSTWTLLLKWSPEWTGYPLWCLRVWSFRRLNMLPAYYHILPSDMFSCFMSVLIHDALQEHNYLILRYKLCSSLGWTQTHHHHKALWVFEKVWHYLRRVLVRFGRCSVVCRLGSNGYEKFSPIPPPLRAVDRKLCMKTCNEDVSVCWTDKNIKKIKTWQNSFDTCGASLGIANQFGWIYAWIQLSHLAYWN